MEDGALKQGVISQIKRGVYNSYTLDVPKIRQISNPLIFELVHCQSSNLVYKIHTSGNLLVVQKRTTNTKLIAIAQKLSTAT